ncbi:MAG: winged helix-turn-helix transcriptional regulator [Acidobacteriota bacterium]|nr:winged helix-turn-helix transcriptional regulator [Acidobacteriota bacterium]
MSWYDISVPTSDPPLHALAEFRFLLRRFLHFSEEAANQAGLTPQQHQLLLQIAGAPAHTAVTIRYLASRLALRHHTVVELCSRCEEAGLVVRRTAPSDGRSVLIRMTAAGSRVLASLSAQHTRELHELGPALIKALRPFTAVTRPVAAIGTEP